MSLKNLFGKQSDEVQAASACGSGDKKPGQPAACGTACGSGDKKPAACGAACGAGDKK